MLRLLAVALLLIACNQGKAKAPPCGAVAAKFLVLAQADVERAGVEKRADETARRAVLDQLPAMRDALAHACTDSAWSEAVRQCLVDAPDPAAFEACQTGLTASQRAALRASAAGTSSAASPSAQPSP